MTRRRTLASLGGVIVTAMAFAGCSSSEPTSATAAQPTSPTATKATKPPATTAVPTTRALTEQEQVVEAYQGAVATLVKANNPPDPNYPGIEQYYTGEASALVVQTVKSNVDGKIAFKPGPSNILEVTNPTVTINDDTASLQACVLGRHHPDLNGRRDDPRRQRSRIRARVGPARQVRPMARHEADHRLKDSQHERVCGCEPLEAQRIGSVVAARRQISRSWRCAPGRSGHGCAHRRSLLNPASSGPALECSYTVSVAFKALDWWLGVQNPEVGKRYRLRCYDPVTGDLVVDQDVVYQNGPPPVPPAVLAQTARQSAEAQLDPPNPSISVNPPTGRQLVGMPTWLWIDDRWQPLSATATVGTVSSTVTATPRDVQWNLGDGTTITCNGPGVRYDLDRQPAEQQSDCTHTYINRSTVNDPDGSYTIAATVTYDVSWTATTGQGGNLGTITRTATVAVVVREAQALIN